MTKAKILEKHYREQMECQDCKLSACRGCFFRGAGDTNAKVLLLSSKPSKDDVAEGYLITEPHRELITSFLGPFGLTLDDVWVTSTVACGHPEGSDPKISQIKACRPWLEKEIRIIQPNVIVALGNLALKALIPKQPPPISNVIGRTIDVRIMGDLIEFAYPALVTYSLGYLLRSQDTSPGGLWNKFFNHLNRAIQVANQLEQLREI